MGNCPSATAATCCPNSSWANGASRGLPSQLTFDYDEIDDLEFENLLNDPHGPNGAFGGGPRPSTALWNRIAALFRLRRQSVGGSLIPSGGFRVGGYQAVPTDGDQGELVPGPMPPSHHHHHHGMNNDEFLRHEEDAELMSNEQIRRITSFIHEQPRSQQPPPQASPSASSDQAVSAPTSPEHIDPNDPLAAFLSEGQTESVPAPASSITQTAVTASTRSQSPTQSEQTPKFPAARPMTTFTSFRPKKRTSASASSAASAAAAFGSSFAAPLDDGLPADDEGFG
ncbi:hypothetical protein DFJ77DRAFT_473025 [Powellomyces hirtus]|nr:hypothetical protein DFJ77DRAFT_473025 [Powellomyces hirtus]